MGAAQEVWYVLSGSPAKWRAANRVPVDPSSRAAPSALIKPTALNTGAMTPVNSLTLDGTTTTINTPDTTISGRYFSQPVLVRASGVTLSDCYMAGDVAGTGGTSGFALDVADPSAGALFVDVTVRPGGPGGSATGRTSGIGWRGFTARRCDISGCVDGVDTIQLSGQTAVNVLVEGCHIHDLAFFDPDPTGSHANGTHNDLIQMQGGDNVVIRWCNLPGFVDNTLGTQNNPNGPLFQATCIQTGNVGRGPCTNSAIVENWLDGGGYSVNLNSASGPAGWLTITGNRFGHNQKTNATCIGGTDISQVVLSGNVYEDSGSPAKVSFG